MDNFELLKQIAKEQQEDLERVLDVTSSGNGPGECYTNAGRFVVRKIGLWGEPFRLVHGTVEGKDHPRHDHAWVEWGGDDGAGLVFDPSTGKPTAVMVTIPDFYRLGKAEVQITYTYEQLIRLTARTGHWGPWSSHDIEVVFG